MVSEGRVQVTGELKYGNTRGRLRNNGESDDDRYFRPRMQETHSPVTLSVRRISLFALQSVTIYLLDTGAMLCWD